MDEPYQHSNGSERKPTNGRLRGEDSVPPSSRIPNEEFRLIDLIQKLDRRLTTLEDRIVTMADSVLSIAANMSLPVQQHKATLESLNRLETLARETLKPMAELILKLRNRDVDEYILKTVVLAIAHVIDRQGTEITDEQQEMPFSFIENCRAMDREELLALLSLFGVEQFGTRLGSRFDARLHSIKKVRTTENPAKIGHIVKILRPGYRRPGDGWVVRPVWVEVRAPPTAHCD